MKLKICPLFSAIPTRQTSRKSISICASFIYSFLCHLFLPVDWKVIFTYCSYSSSTNSLRLILSVVIPSQNARIGGPKHDNINRQDRKQDGVEATQPRVVQQVSGVAGRDLQLSHCLWGAVLWEPHSLLTSTNIHSAHKSCRDLQSASELLPNPTVGKHGEVNLMNVIHFSSETQL